MADVSTLDRAYAASQAATNEASIELEAARERYHKARQAERERRSTC